MNEIKSCLTRLISQLATSAHASSCKSADDDDEMKLVRYQVLNSFIKLMGHKRVYFPLATVRDNDPLQLDTTTCETTDWSDSFPELNVLESKLVLMKCVYCV